MEEQSQISYDPQDEKLNESVFSLYPEEFEKIQSDINKEDKDDFKELLSLFCQKKPKNSKRENNNYTCFINQSDIPNNSLNYDNKKVFLEKLKHFLLQAYKIICEDNEQNELIYKEIIDEDNDNNDEMKFLNILNQFIKNEKENYEMEISFKDKKVSFNENFFIINLKEKHKINMCNDLLKIKIKIKLEIQMAISNGNSQIIFHYMEIKYNGDKPKLKLKPNFKYIIINSFIGKRGITYCNCDHCERCKYRYKFPFDDLLFYLRIENKIKNDLKFTDLYFKGYNSYKNDSNYKCSFCKDFYAKKLNIVRLFCINERDPNINPEHTCQFWICKECYFKKYQNRNDEECPNCHKFMINFTILKSYKKWKNQ